MNSVSIKSCDNSTTLSFRLLGSTSDAIDFVASISGAPFIGEVQSTTYFSGPPSLLFREMAESWKGWKGEKVWSALDGELYLSAATTSLGHVTLKIEMTEQSADFKLYASLGLEAGQLEDIYNDIASVFPLNDL
ncbi:DUF6228 family protein [Methylomonas sp. MO1]|uniref:DUF6228 family protein n=1 Tax=unclassified Methylomonas TaxID=2608980 RepID=UPI001268AA0D|nr:MULTISPECIES: DUF6228 family protein [unclassified Methylomonas]MDT4288671.1 DUF6228 family protein [Methylomonas sp. MO1]